MANPVREARRTLGLTQEMLAERVGVHIQAVFLTEQGVYPHILPSILSYFRTHQVSDYHSMNEKYSEFQKEKRIASGEQISLALLDDLGAPDLSRHPFEAFLEKIGLSRSRFAKNFCVHPASLYKLEHGDARHLPDQLWKALEEAGLSKSVIWELDSRCEEYANGCWRSKPQRSSS